MPTTDPIADMLTRIRNGHMARHQAVTMPTSKMKEAIARILEQERFIESFEVRQGASGWSDLTLRLRYDRERQPGIRGIKRVSRPGLRVYTKRREIPRVLGGMGIAILSTPRGVLSGTEADAQQVGGEVLCYVY